MFNKLFKSKKHIFGVEPSEWLFVAASLVAYISITLATISKFSIWFDEAFGAYLIRFNFFDIAKYTAVDVHPPLYYWLLKIWSLMFGTSELALRSMSTFFGAIAIIFGYILVNKLFSKKAARISLIFMALSPMLVRYGQEARMYTLVAAIALAATYVSTIAVSSKKRTPWVIYGILVALGMWTHYFSAIVWIAHWIWRADNIRRTAPKGKFKQLFFSKEWIMAHIVAVGSFLPWLPFMAKQMTVIQVGGFWIPAVTPATPLNFLTNVFYYQDIVDVKGWPALLFIGIIALLAILTFYVYKSQNKAERESYRLISIIAFVPIIILFITSMPPFRSSFIDRYLITSTLAISLFMAITFTYGLKLIRTKWRYLPIILVAGLMIFGVSNVYQLGNYNKNSHDSNNTRQIIQAATDKSEGNQPIIAATPWLFYEAAFYSNDKHPIFYIEPSSYPYGSLAMLQENDQFKIKDVDAFTKQNKTFWYIAWIKDVGLDGFKSPDSKWKELQRVSVNDSVDGKPSYIAVQFEIVNN